MNVVMLRKETVAKPGNPTGRNQYSDELGNADNVSNSSNDSRHGNRKDYTLTRLHDQRPDLFDRVKTGELSVHAAAIEAGWRKPT